MTAIKCHSCRRTFFETWAVTPEVELATGLCQRCDAPARRAREAALEAERAAFYADPAREPCECGECREHAERAD
jgi:hypothetical protein